MILRGATKRDFNNIKKLLESYDFKLEFNHLESLVVVEDNGVVVAVGSLQTILEAMFIVDKDINKRKRAAALSLILTQSSIEVKALGYDNFHSFATNESIKNILTKRGAKKVEGEVLIKWI